MRAERFDNREINFTVRRINGISLDVIESSIGIRLVVRIEAVEIHHPDERRAAYCSGRQVIDIRSRGVAHVFDVEFEVARLNLVSAKRIYVLHCQVPHRHFGGNGGAFQQLHIQRFSCRCHIAGKLAHLIGLSAIGVLISHGKHLVGV